MTARDTPSRGFKVNVTKAHIENAHQCDSGKCPVALALKQMFPRSTVQVLNYSAKVGKKIYALPDTATRFIGRYDNAHRPERCKPVSFNLGKRP